MIEHLLKNSKLASSELALLDAEKKNECLEKIAQRLEQSTDKIIKANKIDLENGKKQGLSSALIDRLELNQDRIAGIIKAVREIIELDDPTGRLIDKSNTSSGLEISKVTVPIGVIGIIYESRPNVTVDSACLCFKAGNAVILRGGKEAINSNLALWNAICEGMKEAGGPEDAIQLIQTTDRAAVTELIRANQSVDLIIPRGGENLIHAVTENATVPVIKHYKGVCHLYVDKDADLELASKIAINAKCQRPGVCNSIETLLVHEAIAEEFLPKVTKLLHEEGVELRVCSKSEKYTPAQHIQATEEDWHEEYLELIISIKTVADVKDAIEHINTYGSSHSDAIVTNNEEAKKMFQAAVDSAAVYVNTSTRFTDGGEFGLGAEIGISTDKLHARGPMGLNELVTYKFLIESNGVVRQ